MSNKENKKVNDIETKENGKAVEVKAKDLKKDKKKKQKGQSKIAKSLKETGNELKKISWPTFKEVCKQTGIVLAFVFVSAVVIFGFERLCSWLTGFLF